MLNLADPVWEFYRLMGAVLAANLLTVAFVWAIFQISRREQQGIPAHGKGNGVYLATMIMVFGFLFGGLIGSGLIL